MGRREAEEARQGAATLVRQAGSGGYKRACEVGGAIFVAIALTPYGGWHTEVRTWRSPGLVRLHIRAMGWGITSSTRVSNIRGEPGRARRKQAMKQVLGIKNEAARMKVTPPLAVAPLAHGDDMRWNPNDNGIDFTNDNHKGTFVQVHHKQNCNISQFTRFLPSDSPLLAV